MAVCRRRPLPVDVIRREPARAVLHYQIGFSLDDPLSRLASTMSARRADSHRITQRNYQVNGKVSDTVDFQSFALLPANDRGQMDMKSLRSKKVTQPLIRFEHDSDWIDVPASMRLWNMYGDWQRNVSLCP